MHIIPGESLALTLHPPEKAWYALTRSRVVGSQGNPGDASSDASIVLDGTDRRLTGVFVRDNGGKPGLFARLDSKDHKGEFWQTWALASLTVSSNSIFRPGSDKDRRPTS